MNLLKNILQNRYLFKILAIVCLLLTFFYTKTIKKTSVYTNETTFIGTIYKIKYKNKKTTIYLKAQEKLVIYYNDILNDEIELGDTVLVKGILTEPKNNTIPNLFNYKEYLYNNDIFHIVNSSNIKKIANNTNPIYYLRKNISSRITKISKSSEYLSVFVLNDNSLLDDSVISSYRNNGISHLFTISGMHISLFSSIMLFFLKRVSYNNFYNYGIVITFLAIYSILIGISPSVLRSLTMYIIFCINKLFNLKIKSIDLMCIVLIIIIFLNPYYIYNISFQYSYIITFILVLFNYKLKKLKNNFYKSMYVSLITFMSSIPLCIYNNYQLNFLSLILNIFFVPLISIIVFPLSLITFIFPFFSYPLSIFLNIIEKISLFISKYKIGIVSFSKPSFILILIYYIFIILFIYNKKNIYIFLLIIYHKYIPYLNLYTEINLLDVKQGDSIFIEYPFNQGNVLVDTGGIVNSNYELVLNYTIPYLNSKGITQIDYLILTHGDYDHMGEAINLVNNFKVENVIFNCGEFNDLEKKLISVLNKKNIKYYSCINELNISNNKMHFLNNNDYGNENDNSIVLYTKINNYKFLFMGDASVKPEKNILSNYNLKDIDVIKVGHHGSRTSSSSKFIKMVNPKYSVISVGKNNKYGHPDSEVLEILDKSKIYRTDIDGSIMFKIKNNKLDVDTCPP